MRVDEYGALVKSIDVTNLLVDYFRISMENTRVDASWTNVNNERHDISIYTVVISGFIYSNEHKNKDALHHRYQKKSIDASFIAH